MKLIKLIVLFASCLCFSLFANERTDSVVLTKKSTIKIPTSTNSVDTGITIENGDVWVWGYRDHGMQGGGANGILSNAPPARASVLVDKGVFITQVAAGIYHMIALDDQGNVWGWGQNLYAEAVGYPTPSNLYHPTPTLILEGKDVVMINCGEYTSYALTRSGDVYAWGSSFWGQMANGKMDAVATEVRQLPQEYFNYSPVIMIGAGYESAYAITKNGQIFGWGDDESDQFGHSNGQMGSWVNNQRLRPVEITNLPPDVTAEDIATITGGNRFTAFLTSDGRVYAMGAANHLGIGFGYLGGQKKTPQLYSYDTKDGRRYEVDNDTSIAYPQFVMDDVDTLYCRYAGCTVITNERELYTWGVTVAADEHANLWQIMYGYKAMKREINGDLTKIDGGKEHIIYWNDKGEAFGVGWNNQYKLGAGPITVDWPGRKLDFVVNEMKKVYGESFVPGQGY